MSQSTIDQILWKKLTQSEQSKVARDLALTQRAMHKVQRAGLPISVVAKRLKGILQQASRFHISYAKSKVAWATVMWRDEQIFRGLPVWNVLIVASKPTTKNSAAICQQLRTWSRHYNQKTIMTLAIDNLPLAERLRKVGFGVEFVVLRGKVSTSRKLLNLKSKTPPPPYVIEQTTNLKYLPAIRSIKRREFRRNPQFGWMCASDTYLNADMNEIRAGMKSGMPYYFVVKDPKKVVGYFGIGAGVPTNTKHSAGVEIDLDVSAQGQGLAKYAYAHMLETMSMLGVKTYQGGTSHPNVMRLAHRMGREPIALVLRWRAFENHKSVIAFLRRKSESSAR